MAKTLSIPTGRGDLFRANPYDVRTHEEDRGRNAAPTEEAIIRMAESMHDYGQLQPVECRSENQIPYLVSGYTRMAAGRLIREGFTGLDGKERHNPDFQLKFLVVDSNKEGGFKRNVIENAHRNATSAIDDAKNQARLRDQNGMSESEIADLYRCDVGKVTRLRRLLELPDNLQQLVHTGELAVDSAITLLNAPAESREAIVKAAKNGTGVIKSSTVKAQVREHHLRDTGPRTDTTVAPKPKKIARSYSEVKEYIKNASIRPATERKEVAVFLETLMEFCDGTATVEQIDAALDALA